MGQGLLGLVLNPIWSFEVLGDQPQPTPLPDSCRGAVGVAFDESVLFCFNLVPTPFLTLGNSLGGGDPLLAEGENVRAVKLFNYWRAERTEKKGKMTHLGMFR